MPSRIFFVDDSPREREDVARDIADFLPGGAEVVTEGEVGMAIIRFRQLMGIDEGATGGAGLHAAILDFQLDRLTSMPLFRQMLALAPEFARTRVALRTSLSEEQVRSRFAENELEFPSKYLSKGHLIDLINWLKGLPEGE
ncbi:MAG: hypothetical protein PHX93_04755 [Candidatus Peribacteraceae bacterium]|jgi:hypothetical protein|nr:hypothetical protein [Candidatus Peribacteraceae bacterium]